jgi:hypothetical protein
MHQSEIHLQHLTREKGPTYLSSFVFGNPHFEKIETELSSIFDNIIFQISSVFDYISHIVCYMFFSNKSATDYWTGLAKLSRGTGKELKNENVRKIVDQLDRRFVGKLYDYRSRLLHKKRDVHQFDVGATADLQFFNIRMLPSNDALKHFQLATRGENENCTITLTYLASWLIKRTYIEMELLMDVLAVELQKNSSFGNNIISPKRGENSLMFASYDKETMSLKPSSDMLWEMFKSGNIS